jgi:hypothetical protein
VFGTQGYNDVRATYDLLLGRLNAYARAFIRLFSDETTSYNQITPQSAGVAAIKPAGGGVVGGRVTFRRGLLRLDGWYMDGYGGLNAGMDLSGRMVLLGDPFTGLATEGRVSYMHFQDDSRTIDHADSFGLQAGIRYTIASGMTFNVLIEENVNRFYSSQFRAIALIDLSFYLGSRGRGFARPRAWAF